MSITSQFLRKCFN